MDAQILNPFNEKDTTDDKLSILDIKARDQKGRHYNIEMQMVGTDVFPHRALYYWAVVHGHQLQEGDDYTGLQPTISISFVDSVLFPKVPDYHLDFQLRSSRHPELVYSTHQSMHLIELPKFKRTAEELVDPLDVWCYFLTHGAELDTDNLPKALRTPAVHQAMEALIMLTQDDLERERYEARLKGERDRSYFAKYATYAREEALERGRQEGLQEGLQVGLQGRIHFCQRLLGTPMTPGEQLLALSVGELEAIVADLEKQVMSRS